jgi:hypothetical protein
MQNNEKLLVDVLKNLEMVTPQVNVTHHPNIQSKPLCLFCINVWEKGCCFPAKSQIAKSGNFPPSYVPSN